MDVTVPAKTNDLEKRRGFFGKGKEASLAKSLFVVHHGCLSSEPYFSKEHHCFRNCFRKCSHRNHIQVQVHLTRL